MNKKSRQKFKYLENDKSFQEKHRMIFKGFLPFFNIMLYMKESKFERQVSVIKLSWNFTHQIKFFTFTRIRIFHTILQCLKKMLFRPLSYRNQSINKLSKLIEWFLCHERIICNIFRDIAQRCEKNFDKISWIYRTPN